MKKQININVISYYISGLLIVISIYGMISFLEMGNAIDIILKENMISVNASENMYSSITKIHLIIVQAKNSEKTQDSKKIERLLEYFYKNLNDAENNITIGKEREIINEIKTLITTYKDNYRKSLKNSNEILYLKSTYSSLVNSITNLSSTNKQAMLSSNMNAKKMSKNRSLWMFFLTFIGFISVFYFNKFIKEKFHKPLYETQIILKQIDFGESHLRLKSREGYLGEISFLMNNIIDKLYSEKQDYVGYSSNQRNLLMAIIDNFNKPIFILNNHKELISTNSWGRTLFFETNNSKLLNDIINDFNVESTNYLTINNKKYEKKIIELNSQNIVKLGYLISLIEC